MKKKKDWWIATANHSTTTSFVRSHTCLSLASADIDTDHPVTGHLHHQSQQRKRKTKMTWQMEQEGKKAQGA